MQIRRLIVLVPLVSGLLYACEEESEIPAGYEDVEYLGGINDETVASLAKVLETKTPQNVPALDAVLDVPAEGAAIPKVPLTTFTWHIGPTSSLNTPAGRGREPFTVEAIGDPATNTNTNTNTKDTKSPAWAALSRQSQEPASRIESPLGELLGPLRSARADGPAFTGAATFLVFSTDSNAKLVRVLTSETKYTPSQAAWDKLNAAGTTITATLMTVTFVHNEVAEDGGPFTGGSSHFTITPPK